MLIQNNKKMSGIYKITNIINNKVYIGLTIHLNRRWAEHKNDLIKNKHFNRYLQNSVNKYGIQNFKFEVLEQVEADKDKLSEREIFWINKYKSLNIKLYNIGLGGYDGNGLKGELNSNYDSTLYTFYKIDSDLIEKDITFWDMQQKYNIKNKNFYNLKDSSRITCAGWSLKNPKETKIRRTGFKYNFINKDGIIEREITVIDFCKKYNLKLDSIGDLVRKCIKTSNGWAIYDENYDENNTFVSHKVIIVTKIKTGVETRFDTVNEASKYFNVSRSSIYQVLSNKTKTFKKRQYTARYV